MLTPPAAVDIFISDATDSRELGGTVPGRCYLGRFQSRFLCVLPWKVLTEGSTVFA